MSPTSYQAALPRVIPSLLSATLIIIPYSNSFVKRVRKVFLQRKQRMKTRLLTFFEPLPVKRTMKKTRFFLPRAIVFLAFQNAPESFHWAVVNAVGYTRHALCHTRIFQHVVKSMTCVLKPTVAMEQRVRVRIGFYSSSECVEHNRIVVVLANYIRDNASVIQVKNGTQIDLVDFRTFISFELRNICQPFFIRLLRMKISVQLIFCLCSICTTFCSLHRIRD